MTTLPFRRLTLVDASHEPDYALILLRTSLRLDNAARVLRTAERELAVTNRLGLREEVRLRRREVERLAKRTKAASQRRP